MGKASRIKAQRDGQFVRTPKTPTARHLTPKEKQVLRRESRRLDESAVGLIDRLARSVRERNLEEKGL